MQIVTINFLSGTKFLRLFDDFKGCQIEVGLCFRFNNFVY